MNAYQANRCGVVWLLPLAVAAGLISALEPARGAEETLAVLQTKTAAYTNVTVTTKAKTYVFILHSSGMTSVKVADLSPEAQEQLGYASAGSGKAATNTATAWAKREIAKIDTPQIKALSRQVEQKWRGAAPMDDANIPSGSCSQAQAVICCSRLTRTLAPYGSSGTG